MVKLVRSRTAVSSNLVLGALATTWLVLIALDADVLPRCPIHAATGLFCPGCGGQRAVRELINLDVMAAASQNLLVVIGPGLMSLGWLAGKSEKFKWVMIVTTTVITLWFVIARNIEGSWMAPS